MVFSYFIHSEKDGKEKINYDGLVDFFGSLIAGSFDGLGRSLREFGVIGRENLENFDRSSFVDENEEPNVSFQLLAFKRRGIFDGWFS